MEDGWKLPAESRALILTVDELLLVDWVICPMSQMIPGLDLRGSLDWHTLRLKVWALLSKLDPDEKPASVQEPEPQPGHVLALSEPDAESLLAVIPTTFRWSPALGRSETPDCGFSLKSKMYQFLTRDYAPERPPAQTEAAKEVTPSASTHGNTPDNED